MRVLVINLLRLGDFIQVVPVLQALKTQYSIRELDLLTHQPVKQLAPMISGIKNWYTIDRDEMQSGLGRADIPLLTSFSVLKEQLDTLNARNYDCVINLTQTVYSAWIAGYLSAGQRYGLSMDIKGQAHFHSSWFQYLDDHAPLNVSDIFHYTDIFHYGCGLKGSERLWNLKETRHGRAEAAPFVSPSSPKIILQTLTSDSKKNWSEESWAKMLSHLRLFRPNAEFIALGAPNEEERIDSLISTAFKRAVTVKKAILSLEGALSLLKESDLLITGDTSIKHLANAANIPILELSLGSSDWRRTGAYVADSLIVQSVIECAPCPHSMPCRKSTHECAAKLSPESVSLAAHHYMNFDWLSLREIAKEYTHEVRFMRTKNLSTGFWMAIDLNEQQPERAIETMVERCTWRFVLSREHLDPLARFGSEGIHLKRELESIFPGQSLVPYSHHLSFLESQAGAMGERAASLLKGVKNRSPETGEIKEFLLRYQPQASVLTWLENLAEVPSEITSIGSLRRMQNQLEHFYDRSQVKMKLIRSLKSQLTETK